MIEYTIKIKDEKSSISEKFVVYEGLFLSAENEELKDKIQILYRKFRAHEPDAEESAPEIVVTAKMVVQS